MTWKLVFRCLTGLAIAVLADRQAFAQEGTLILEQAAFQPSVQVGRPIPTWWDVSLSGTTLVEGRFEFRMFNDDRRLSTLVTDDLALAPPQQRIRVLLPPVSDEYRIEQLRLEITFHGRGLSQKLPPQILRVALPKLRTFMVLNPVSSLTKRDASRAAILQRLEIESLGTDLSESTKSVRINLDPRDLPQDPLQYCAFDLVVVLEDEFRLLKAPQLDALLAWVRAGGKLYLEPAGVLEPYHVGFLNGLLPDLENLVAGPDGRLLPDTFGSSSFPRRAWLGFGRVLVRLDDFAAAPDVETREWRSAAAYLWKLRRTIQTRVEATDATTLLPDTAEASPRPTNPYSSNPYQYQDIRITRPDLNSDLIGILLPRGVQMVPLWVLALLLGGFVLWIGVFDYRILGWLRMRKYTWVTFPLATLAVTWLTLWISNQYMTAGESRRNLIIHDVGPDGVLARTHNFQLLFQASTHLAETAVQKSLIAPLKSMQLSMGRQPGYPGGYPPPYVGTPVIVGPPAQLKGRIPTAYTLTQDVAQWTPQLNRQFSIPGPEAAANVDLAAIVRAAQSSALNLEPARPLAQEIFRQFGPEARSALIGFGQPLSLSNHWNSLSYTPNSDASNLWMVPENVRNQGTEFRWLYYHSAASDNGAFLLVSSISPTAGASLEDLPLLDESDSDQGLLIIAVPRGDDLVVYRLLLQTEVEAP